MAWRLSIDFGTSNTAAAIDSQGVIRPIALSESGTSMPSAIVLTPHGFRVGEEAVNAQLRHPDGFERSPKMLVGRDEVVLAGEIVSPTDIIREIYSHVRGAALRRQDGAAPTEVWLTHPVAWAPSQIDALREGAVAAGFAAESIRTVNEPIAAAAHYARNHRAAPGSRVAVFDFGGGTLDLAVLERAPQLPEGYTVLAYGGDPVLGGRTFDARLLDWTLETLARRGHTDLADRLHRPQTMSELRAQTTLSRAVTAAKIELSTRPDADIAVSLGEEDAVVTITRKEYERLIADDLDRAGKLLTDVFAAVSGPAPEVLYLTGGSSRTPSISHMIRDRTGIRIATLDDPKLVVAEGALHVAPIGATRPQQPHTPLPPAAVPMPMPPANDSHRAGQPEVGQAVQGRQAGPGHHGGPGHSGPGAAPGDSGTHRGHSQNYQPTAQYGSNATGNIPRQAHQPQQPQPHLGQPHRAQPQQSRPAQAYGFAAPDGRPPGAPGTTGPHSSAAGASATGSAKTKNRNRLLIALSIAAAIIVVVGGIFLIPGMFNNDLGGEATPTPYDDEEIVVASGPIDCWDGTTAAEGENCAPLSGQAGLEWLVKFDGASCAPVDSASDTQLECNWYDRPQSFVYVMEFDSYDDAVGYAESLYQTDSVGWQVEGEDAGPHWEGEFTDGDGGYSHVYLYEGQPYGIFVRMDNNPKTGQHDDIEDFRSRFTPRPLSEVAHAVATTNRV